MNILSKLWNSLMVRWERWRLSKKTGYGKLAAKQAYEEQYADTIRRGEIKKAKAKAQKDAKSRYAPKPRRVGFEPMRGSPIAEAVFPKTANGVGLDYFKNAPNGIGEIDDIFKEVDKDG